LWEAIVVSKTCVAAAPSGCAGWRCTHRQLTSFGADDHLRPGCQSRHRSFCRSEDSHDLEATHPDLPQGAMCTASAGNEHLRQFGHGGTAHVCILRFAEVYMFLNSFECTQIHAHKYCLSLPLLIWWVQVDSCLHQRPGPASAKRTHDVQASAKRPDQSNSRELDSNCNQSLCAIRCCSMPAARITKNADTSFHDTSHLLPSILIMDALPHRRIILRCPTPVPSDALHACMHACLPSKEFCTVAFFLVMNPKTTSQTCISEQA